MKPNRMRRYETFREYDDLRPQCSCLLDQSYRLPNRRVSVEKTWYGLDDCCSDYSKLVSHYGLLSTARSSTFWLPTIRRGSTSDQYDEGRARQHGYGPPYQADGDSFDRLPEHQGTNPTVTKAASC